MLQFAVNLKLKDKKNKTVFDYVDRSLGGGVAHALELAEGTPIIISKLGNVL